MNQGWIYRERVKPADAGQTVLEYYSNKYKHSSRTQWEDRITSGQILLDDRPVSTTAILQPQDRLVYHRQPWNEPEVSLKFDVLYGDRELLVINKPSGLPVLPGGSFLEHTLLWQLKKQYPNNTPVPVHRLGRGTSGLLLLARSQLAKSHLAKQMRDRTLENNSQISKIYRALVSGNQMRDRFTIDRPIGKIPHPVLGYVYGATPEGKYAKSECQIIERYLHCALLEVEIFTGRPHQIRIHLAAIGYPLLGDPLYVTGGSFAKISPTEKIPVPGDCGYFLHASRLSFAHPQTLQQMNFECPTPQRWQEVCRSI